jgi:hypothetical protein
MYSSSLDATKEGKQQQRVQGEMYTAPEERKPTIHVSMHMNRAKSAFLVVAASRIRRRISCAFCRIFYPFQALNTTARIRIKVAEGVGINKEL